MKNLILSICFLSVALANAQEINLKYGGNERSFLIHLPINYNSSQTNSMVIAMHGGLGSGSQLETQSGLSDVADKEGFIVVYPNGIENQLKIRTWNAGACCGYARDNKIDDVGFISAVIDYMMDSFNIDSQRVYATGISNGAFMAYRLACELSDRIAAIAPVAGSMNLPECKPKRPVPIIHFHSRLDKNIPFEGGVGSGLSDHYNPPIDSVMQVWKAKDHCADSSFVSFTHDMVLYKWSACDCQYEIEYYLTDDGGHSWPGGERTSVLLDKPSTAISASQAMWSFFEKHRLCKANSQEELNGNQIIIYPNPAKTSVSLSGLEKGRQYLMEILNISGEVVLANDLYAARSAINIESLLPGVYLIKCQNTDGIWMSRLVVN